MEQQEKSQRTDLIDAYLDAVEDKNTLAVEKVFETINQHNKTYLPLTGGAITPEMLVNAALSRKLTKAQRLFLYNKRKGAAYDKFMKE